VSQQDPILEAALQNRLITRKQHGTVLEEMSVLGRSSSEILVARRFVTPAQLERLSITIGADLPQSTPEQRPASLPPAVLPPTAEAVRSKAAKAKGSPGSSPPPKSSDPAPAPLGPPPKQPKTLKDMLRLARHWGASDLHITVGRPPFVRIHGQIRYMEMEAVTAEQAEILNFSLMTPEQREEIVKSLNLDFAVEIPGVGRHRCNVFHQRLGWDGVYRIVASRIPTFEELGLPPVCKTLTEYQQGMVLVTGPARSGKTTTVAAMVDLVNRSREDHIITIEDPIEYVHRRQRCQVTQREVGSHTRSFATSLRAALREDPDIILIGELRDHETISISISAAETGHLVFGSLHTGSAARTVTRILDAFPFNQQDQIAIMISESMRGIISQRLLPRADKQGLVLAMEILVVTSGVSTLIRDRKSHQLVSAMQSGRKIGMQTMDDGLMDLAKRGLITGQEAYFQAENKPTFESIKNGVPKHQGVLHAEN
jgi:twitching motility protein PilT